MADTTMTAGSTIDFVIALSNPVDNYDNIFVTLYGDSTTNKGRVVFSLVENEKFSVLNKTGANEVSCKVLGSQSAKMRGRLMYEMKLIIKDGDVLLEEKGSNIPVDTTIVIIDNESKNL